MWKVVMVVVISIPTESHEPRDRSPGHAVPELMYSAFRRQLSADNPIRCLHFHVQSLENAPRSHGRQLASTTSLWSQGGLLLWALMRRQRRPNSTHPFDLLTGTVCPQHQRKLNLGCLGQRDRETGYEAKLKVIRFRLVAPQHKAPQDGSESKRHLLRATITPGRATRRCERRCKKASKTEPSWRLKTSAFLRVGP
ncbi:hypothetical protein B0J13DRAFT_232193 [Dactylonectria estremocensis]|uniref:Uncharacterized protein n=1 Tax=Dactylonectria estremocensis TaxID=1079267 RepID=A0A9P9F551_9HYPO|nr:hypothetical protein B0J13DRAFT_232193 [Dactylonectria estremocensis]